MILYVGLFLACDSPFSYSPFEARVPVDFRNTTQKNLERIAALNVPSDSLLQIALISDTHYHFNDLADALDQINNNERISFIIVTGDITENGLQKEFELFHHQMARSIKPYLTVIGNHDYLSNGGEVYKQMFGPFNYSFTFGGVKFVMWDNVRWESNRIPDWKWLERELSDSASDKGAYNLVIPFSHIPPFDKQLSDSAAVFHDVLDRHGVKLSIHGHRHEYGNDELFGSGIRYVTIGSPQKRAYAILTIASGTVTVEKVKF